ncbi:hypothetical protein ACEPPN_012173 [Leptodophora sp. 'Broadleaf-Isolate-01']
MPIVKAETFRVVRTPGGSVIPSLEIILVHGFKSSRTSDTREYLESCLKYATTEHFRTTARASAFAFDTLEVLSKGIDELEIASDKLIGKIKSLRVSSAPHLTRTSPHWNAQEPGKGFRRRKIGDSKPTKFLFIAYGLGAWVVQNGLTRVSNYDLSYDTTGLIFLDVPEPDSITFTYSGYLKGLFEDISLDTSLHEGVMKELVKFLDDVHKKWNNIVGGHDFVRRYKVWSVDSKVEFSTVSILFQAMPRVTDLFLAQRRSPWARRLGRSIGKSSQTLDRPLSGGELGRIFDRIGSDASPTSGESGIERDDFQPGHGERRRSDPGNRSTITAPVEEPLFRVASNNSASALRVEKNFPPHGFKPRNKSAATLRASSSHQESTESASTSFKDEQRVSKISANNLRLPKKEKEEFLTFSNLARLYLDRGNLDNAYVLYQRCHDMLNKHYPKITLHHTQIRMQMGVTLLQKGRYNQAGEMFEVLRSWLESQRETPELRSDIEGELEWWFALTLLRQGRYREAQMKLKHLEKDLERTEILKEEHVLDLAKVRRLLALANGYLGDYTEAFRQIELVRKSFEGFQTRKKNQELHIPTDAGERDHDQSTSPEMTQVESPPTRESIEIQACRHNFEFTESIILMLWGDYVQALETAKSALKGFEKDWGKQHFRSLEVASLVAILRAYNSDTGNASILCHSTLESMTATLGSLHPLTLQAMEVLVYIFRSQSRFTEAVDTSNSLCKRIESSLGSDHPQTLRSKSQLAAAKLACGDYRTSEEILVDVVRASKRVYGEEHPDTLRFQSELARAYCYSWKTKLAEDLVLEVISKQRRIYTIGERKPIPEQQLATETSRKDMLEQLRNDVRNGITTLRVHPDLLFSMQLLAKVESKKAVPNLELVQDIQQIVWDRRMAKLHPTHALSLVSEFELATTYREKGQLQKALETFDSVAKERSKLLGTRHPDTLAARHETLVMKYTLGQKIDVDDLESILRLREWQLGRCHPDTHQSLLWIFAIQLLQAKEEKAFKTADKLLHSLSQPAVRRERLVESLQVAEKVALFYMGQEHYGRSTIIFRDILQTAGNSNATLDKSLSLDALQRCASESLVEAKEKAFIKCLEILPKAQGEFQEGNQEKGDEIVQHAYDLCKAVGWGNDNKTGLIARSQLAETMWKSGIPGRRTEAINMLSKILEVGEGVFEREMLKGLHGAHESWAKHESALKPNM